ncbi:hypothetical protein Tco_0369632 [Tanacetum coccineum]
MANLPPDHNEFALPAEDAPNNMNGWIKEEEEEEEEEEMEIDDEMDDPEVIYPYEIEEGELPPPHAESDNSSNTKPEVEAEVEGENEAATVGTITRAPYRVQPFSGQGWTRSSSSAAAAGHNPEDHTPSHIRSDLDALHRRMSARWATLAFTYHLRRGSITLRLRIFYAASASIKESHHYALLRLSSSGVTHIDPRDPYVAARDAATAPATDNDDSPTQKETSPSEPQGSPPRRATKAGFMKCNPIVFHGHEGAVELSRWFEKTEMVFGISECVKVKFAAATLQGRALTWWNSQVATMGLEAANQIGWTEMRRLMTEEFFFFLAPFSRKCSENGAELLDLRLPRILE